MSRNYVYRAAESGFSTVGMIEWKAGAKLVGRKESAVKQWMWKSKVLETFSTGMGKGTVTYVRRDDLLRVAAERAHCEGRSRWSKNVAA